MIYIPIKHLRAGMVLAREIRSSTSTFPLVAGGVVLTEDLIARLSRSGITGAYVESSIGSDIAATDFIEPQLKRQTMTRIVDVYGEFTKRSGVTSASLRALEKTAVNLVLFLLNKDELLMNMIDLEAYDDYTFRHCLCVGILGVLIGIKMGLQHSTLNEIAVGGLLHDIGKMDIPLAIINKPGPLTDDEYEIVKQHPVNAVRQLRRSPVISSSVLLGIETHHENYDGTGYPYGLAGKKIPLSGRILHLADVYDALTSNRPYRTACLPSEAVEYLMGCAETSVDFDVLQAFLKAVAAYPVGTMVQLSNGENAVVIREHPGNTLRPVVQQAVPEGQEGVIWDLDDPSCSSLTIVGSGYNSLTDYRSLVVMQGENLPDSLRKKDSGHIENRNDRRDSK